MGKANTNVNNIIQALNVVLFTLGGTKVTQDKAMGIASRLNNSYSIGSSATQFATYQELRAHLERVDPEFATRERPSWSPNDLRDYLVWKIAQ